MFGIKKDVDPYERSWVCYCWGPFTWSVLERTLYLVTRVKGFPDEWQSRRLIALGWTKRLKGR
jgi:hypothetical protein